MKKGLRNVVGEVYLEKIKITPLVGDQVVFQADNPTEGYVLEVFDRKMNLLDLLLLMSIKRSLCSLQ